MSPFRDAATMQRGPVTFKEPTSTDFTEKIDFGNTTSTRTIDFGNPAANTPYDESSDAMPMRNTTDVRQGPHAWNALPPGLQVGNAPVLGQLELSSQQSHDRAITAEMDARLREELREEAAKAAIAEEEALEAEQKALEEAEMTVIAEQARLMGAPRGNQPLDIGTLGEIPQGQKRTALGRPQSSVQRPTRRPDM